MEPHPQADMIFINIYQGQLGIERREMIPDKCSDRYGHRCVSIVLMYVIHGTYMYEIDIDIDIDVPRMDGWLNGWMVYAYRYIRPQYHQPTIANLGILTPISLSGMLPQLFLII